MSNGESRMFAYGVSSNVLPAYVFSAGLGSKLSRWLVPPTMNSQITFLALGVKCGRPSGGDQPGRRRRPRAMPSRWSIAPEDQPGEAHAQVGQERPS